MIPSVLATFALQTAIVRVRGLLTPANVAVLKNERAKAARFSTLEAMCRVLGCQPVDLLEFMDGSTAPDDDGAALRAGDA